MLKRPKLREAMEAAPALAVFLVLLLLGLMLWVLHQQEIEEEHQALIKDILWVEQNLHFHLVSNEEKLEQLALSFAQERNFLAQAQHLLNNSPEIIRLIVRKDNGELLLSVPPLGDEGVISSDFSFAKALNKPIYGPPINLDNGAKGFELLIPVYKENKFLGSIGVYYSMTAILDHQVPWWFAQKYQLAIVDADYGIVAAKSKIEPKSRSINHQVAFDPPGHGLSLLAIAYKSETNLQRNLIASAIVGLSLLALLSLWAMRKQSEKRRTAERELQREHAFRKAMEDSLTIGMRARDMEGRIIYVNPAFCRMVGWEEWELVGRTPPMPYWLPGDIERNMEIHRAVLAGNAPPEGMELKFRRKSEEIFDALIYEAPLIDENGEQTGWMGSVLDITERKNNEEILRQQQEKLQRTARLVSMGEMASTLAHEINQPLAAIASYNAGCINLLQNPGASNEQIINALEKSRSQAQRAGEIIRRIYDFVKKREPTLAWEELGQIIENIRPFIIGETAKYGVNLEIIIPEKPIKLQVDRILLEQVILNLVRNAVEALQKNSPDNRSLLLQVKEDEMIKVIIKDNGPGISLENVRHLFSPFFTTKPEGMGMGLNICRSIIEHHRGRLWFEPIPGGGASFIFTLPKEE